MWYNQAPLVHATSKDGVHWEKPRVGTVEVPGIEEHNAVAWVKSATVIMDRADPDPNRRYKMICFLSRRGYSTMVSPDGLNWSLYGSEPICPWSSQPFGPWWDVITGYHDQQRGLYVAFAKYAGLLWQGHKRRCFCVMTSRDFVHWTEPKLAFAPDLRDDAGSLARIEQVRAILETADDPGMMRTEFYGIGAYQHESCTLAFPWVFTANAPTPDGNHVMRHPVSCERGRANDTLNGRARNGGHGPSRPGR